MQKSTFVTFRGLSYFVPISPAILAAEKTPIMEHTALVWIQIPVENMERAAAFYNKTFGFEFFFETLNGIPHAVFKENSNGNRPVNGALIELKDKKEGNGTVLFFEATGRFEIIMNGIEQNGGKILVPK